MAYLYLVINGSISIQKINQTLCNIIVSKITLHIIVGNLIRFSVLMNKFTWLKCHAYALQKTCVYYTYLHSYIYKYLFMLFVRFD